MAEPKLKELRDEATVNYLENIIRNARNILDIESGGFKLIPHKVYVKPEPLSVSSYNKAKVERRSLRTPLYADVSLKDKNTGEIIQEKKKLLLGYIPDITPVGSFLIQGNEYYVPTQFRIKPGVYTRERNDGLLEAWFNTEIGRSFKVVFDSDKEDFKLVDIAGKTIPLFPILQSIAESEDQLRDWFGPALAAKLAKKYSETKRRSALNKLHQALYAGKEQTDPVIAAEEIKRYWSDRPGALDPDSVESSIGVRSNSVSPEVLGRSARHLLNIFKGVEDFDDRDTLSAKKALRYDNLLPMRLADKRIVRDMQYKIKSRLAKTRDIRSSIQIGLITDPIRRFLMEDGSSLAISSDQTNIVSLHNITRKTTIMGEGSISSTDAVVASARDLYPTKIGIIDPVFTPEPKTGVVEHLTRGAVYDDVAKVMETKVWDRKEKKEIGIETSKVLPSGMAFLDQFTKKLNPKSKLIWGYKGEKLGRYPEEEIRYIFHNPEDLFSRATNLIPFLLSNSGPRVMMAAKMSEQAVPLTREEREAPLVYTVNKEGKSFSDEIVFPEDREPLLAISPDSGTIEDIDDTSIKIRTSAGIRSVDLYKNHPLAAKTFLTSEPVVEKGQKVKAGDLLADISSTKNGRLALGKNLLVAYMPFHGYTLDDAMVISDSASRKLTSEHLYRVHIPIDRRTILDKNRFRSEFPEEITGKDSEKYDDNGIIKIGEIIEEDDPVSLGLRKLTPGPISDIYTRLRKRKDQFLNSSINWDRPSIGKVVKVNKFPNEIEIHIQTKEVLEVGDKLSNSYGHKGIVSAIISDRDMPHTKDGKVVDLIIDPVSVPSRANLGQIFELAAAKIAQKTGNPYKVYNFEDVDWHKKLTKELKDAGVSDKEELIDASGKSYGNITVGPQYILKLQHRVAQKMSSRERGGYDIDQTPLRGGTEVGQAKAIDRMLLYSLIASGAKANLSEMSLLKGNKNEEYWRAMESGDPLPTLQVPFAMQKLMAYLNAAGINVSKEGTNLKLLPMTDKDVLSLSNGEIKTPQLIRAKDLQEEKGGLFDPAVTGGIEGKNFAHMTLPEIFPNPIFEKPIASLLNIRERDVAGIISGKIGITNTGEIIKDPTEEEYGGKAIAKALKNINIKEVLAETKESLNKADIEKQPELVNKLNKRARYLRNLSDMKIRPDQAYMMKHISVIPPIYRPLYPLPSGDIAMSDVNSLYQNIGIMSIQFKKAKDLTRNDRNLVRAGLYDAIKTYQGLVQPKLGRKYKGLMEYIAGKGSPKAGMFHRKLLRKEQDIVGRSVAVPNPELGPDDVELPREMAWKMYRPLMMQNLTATGFTPDDASYEIESETPRALRALNIVMEKHPVLLNRAPTLHKFGIVALHAKTWPGKTIRVPHLIARGLALDFDGDEVTLHLPVTPKAAREASALFPTANLFNPGSLDLMLMPSLSTLHGIYHGTTPSLKKSLGSFDRLREIQPNLDSGNLLINDPIKFKGINTTPGSVLLNSKIPEHLRDYKVSFDVKKIKDVLRSVAEKNTSKYGQIVSDMKRFGDIWATQSGLTIGMEDIKPIYQKNPVIDRAIQKSTDKDKTISQADEVAKSLDRILNKTISDSSIIQMLKSGAISKNKISQVKQILMSPVMAQNYRRQRIPVLIKSSYSEGLTPTEYWAASFGARAGMMDRALSTSKPGAFAKEVLASSIGLTITMNDCGTTKGKVMDVIDSFISGRLLSVPHGEFSKNTIIDGNVIRNLRAANIKKLKVRSPATCEAPKGICQKCYGLSESGAYYEIGENIGAISGTTITEPLTSMALTGFHTSGVIEGGGGILTGSPRIFQLLRLPTFVAGAATVARNSGKIDSIKETEAGRVKIDIAGKSHFVQPGNALRVSVGDSIKSGDVLTGGIVNPRDIMITKGVDYFRSFLSDELRRTYKEQNKDIDPRHFELASKVLSDYSQISDPGGSSYIKGDILPVGKIETLNKQLKNKIEHQPYLRGVNTSPGLQEDWLARAGYQRLLKTFQDGAAMGWTSDIEGDHPISSYVYGVKFFKGDSPALKRLNKAWIK